MNTPLPEELLDANGNPNAKYQSYARHMEQWNNAKAAYDNAYADALANPMKLQMWPTQGKAFQDKLDAALNAWHGAGAKQEVESILSKK